MATHMTKRCFACMLMVVATMLARVSVPATSAHAGVSVGIGINLPAPPPLVPVPDTAVTYAPTVSTSYFFYGGRYYTFVGGVWYASPGYNGPWVLVTPARVPSPILAVPVRYYRVPPPEWHAWRHDEPPHWERHAVRQYTRGHEERR